MRPILTSLFLLFAAALSAQAQAPNISIVQGTVEKAEKGSLKISTGDRPKRSLDLKVTGTSNLHLLAPQKRADKTIVTQREVNVADLEPGQVIAVIYTIVDGDKVLLSAVAKPAEKE